MSNHRMEAANDRIGFERESVFKARPHPDLLLQEKEQPEDVAEFAERLSDGFCHWQGLTSEAFPINPWEHPRSNIQHRTSNIEHPTFNAQHPRSMLEKRKAAEDCRTPRRYRDYRGIFLIRGFNARIFRRNLSPLRGEGNRNWAQRHPASRHTSRIVKLFRARRSLAPPKNCFRIYNPPRR
jgi:hypothetical protein